MQVTTENNTEKMNKYWINFYNENLGVNVLNSHENNIPI